VLLPLRNNHRSEVFGEPVEQNVDILQEVLKALLHTLIHVSVCNEYPGIRIRGLAEGMDVCLL
jgi:hypothetical protein